MKRDYDGTQGHDGGDNEEKKNPGARRRGVAGYPQSRVDLASKQAVHPNPNPIEPSKLYLAVGVSALCSSLSLSPGFFASSTT